MLDNLLIMWYSSAILNQEVNFMKYVGSWQGNLKCTLDKSSRSDKIERLYLCKG